MKICPKCGCHIYDPFFGTVKIHDVDKCLGPATLRKENENGMQKR